MDAAQLKQRIDILAVIGGDTHDPGRPPEAIKDQNLPSPIIPDLKKISTDVLKGYLENWEFLAAYDTAWVDFFRVELARRKSEEGKLNEG